MKQRVHHVLRRANRSHTEFRFKDLYMDLRAHRVWRAGQEVELTPREYALLETLVLNRNIALTRGQLLADAWGYDYIGESRTVDVHINRVRRKLGLQHEIQTVFKVGYRLNTRGTL
ncbi:MAG TPA: response regulator transcription factor [Candidatus Gemmiger excrementavium]|uniref:Response regulator transcription factor n=2 Tax=Gemmiger TaxID=204475 RepID=A0A9D2JHF1_9FIRM|nr:response regulator transcription factor [Candidatus Gemmiger excrementavium]